MTTLAALQNQLNAIQAQIDGMKAGEKEEWPQIGDVYFELEADGHVSQHDYDMPEIDDLCVLQGNAFRTEAEATRERDRRALIAELRRHPKASGFMENGYQVLYMVRGPQGWVWEQTIGFDLCPASGYFSEKVIGLIEQYGSRLDLLLGA